MNDRNQIEALGRKLAQAHLDRDAAAISACYAPNAVVYSLAPPLSERGMPVKETREWLDTWRSPVRLDATETELVVSTDIAWSTGLLRIRGEKQGGAKVDMWFRNTMCFRKIDGAWQIVHDHSSTPYYMDGSMRAAVDLTPELVDA